MKKTKLLFLSIILLAGCSNEPGEKKDPNQLNVLCPTGAPAVAFTSNLANPNLKFFSEASDIIALMSNDEADVAVLPTNAGVQQINKGLKYKLAATITFGNLFVASTGLDDDGVMDESDYIVSFQQGNVPDKIFKSVYSVDGGLHYVANAQEAAKCLKLKKNSADNNANVEYVLLAEPALTTLKAGGAEFTIYSNLQEEYKNKFNNQQIFQASIFVHQDLDHEVAETFLGSVKSNVESILANPSLLENASQIDPEAETHLGIKIAPAVSAITNQNHLGIGYVDAYSHKGEIDTFLSIFGMNATNEEIYFK